jgi:hypothetical protein
LFQPQAIFPLSKVFQPESVMRYDTCRVESSPIDSEVTFCQTRSASGTNLDS